MRGSHDGRGFLPAARGGRGSASAALAVAWLAGIVGCGVPGTTADPALEGAASSRVTASWSAAGESAGYAYDDAGNLLQIQSAAAASLAIASFQPTAGGAGEVVTVYGSGFAAATSGNAVTLGGIAATVLSATSTELTFSVPSGAASGVITVASNGNTAVSANSFTVLTDVIITDFTPKIGPVGTVVTITGHNFDAVAANDTVYIGGGAATVTSASATALIVTVTAASTSGKVAVATATASALSSEDFFILPGSAWNVGVTGWLTLGQAFTASIAEAGQSALLLFNGAQGQHLSLYVSGDTSVSPVTVKVYTPSRSVLASGVVSANTKFTLDTLPLSGAYTVEVLPGEEGTGGIVLQVFEDLMAAININGDASTLALAIGQNGRLTFSGTKGDRLGIAWVNVATSPSKKNITTFLWNADGGFVWGAATGAAGSSQIPALPNTGTYTATVQPEGATGASVGYFLSSVLVGAVATDGTATHWETARPGQAGVYSFSELSGSYYTLRATAASLDGGSVVATVYNPSGNGIGVISVPSGGDQKVDLGSLDAGSYSISVVPSGVTTGGLDLRLIEGAAGQFSIDGGSASVALGTGQNGRYAFAGVAGDLLTFKVASLTTVPVGGSVAFNIYRPDGSSMFSANVASATSWALSALSMTGVYTLKIVPSGTLAASVTFLVVGR